MFFGKTTAQIILVKRKLLLEVFKRDIYSSFIDKFHAITLSFATF